MIKLGNNNRGTALILTLFLMGMLSVIAVMAVNNSNTDMELSFNSQNSGKAFYIAEAGAKRSLSQINNNPGWDSGYANISFGGGEYSVDVTDSSTNGLLLDTILLVSTGETHAARSIVEFTLAPEETHPFKYAMFGRDTVDIRNSLLTDSYRSDSGSYFATREDSCGDAGSNGNIIVANGALIGGDVTTSLDSGLSVNPGATITGDTTSTAPVQDVPTIPQSEFDAAAATNDNATGILGPYTLDASGAFQTTGAVTLTGGVYYFSSFVLKNSASITVAPGASATIYVTGDIEIKNSGDINPGGTPSDLMFYSQGDVILKNSSDAYAVFYTDGIADLRNSADFYGAVVATKVLGHNSAGFHYDRLLGDIVKKSTSSWEIVAWREVL